MEELLQIGLGLFGGLALFLYGMNLMSSNLQEAERIRRITGYLVGTLDRFNDAKRAEEHDRVKHDVPAAE